MSRDLFCLSLTTEESRQLCDISAWHGHDRVEDLIRQRLLNPVEPGYQTIGDAIEQIVFDVADLHLTLINSEGAAVTDPAFVLARVLDKAGLIDWAYFKEAAE